MRKTVTTELLLRFEDVAQNGRIILPALQHLLGATTWPDLFQHPWAVALRDQGVVPILTYVELEAGDGPFSNVGCLLRADGRWELGHSKGADGNVERLLVSMWVSADGPIGSTYGPPPLRAGELAFAGKIYAEHVVTRLFAAPADRKVVRLDAPGLPSVPEKELPYTQPESVSVLPEGATILGERESTFTFGVLHTDGNQHVNSLVYARVFEEAALPLLQDKTLMSRSVRMGYRKPFFSGDVATIKVRMFESAQGKGACGTFALGGKAHVHVAMRF